jgi:mRNA interferase HigB
VRIIATARLREFGRRHPEADGPLRAWAAIAQQASWKTPQDVKQRFGTTVDFVRDNRIVFDISCNKYRLFVHASYGHGMLLINFLGTHAEYDRIDAGSVER